MMTSYHITAWILYHPFGVGMYKRKSTQTNEIWKQGRKVWRKGHKRYIEFNRYNKKSPNLYCFFIHKRLSSPKPNLLVFLCCSAQWCWRFLPSCARSPNSDQHSQGRRWWIEPCAAPQVSTSGSARPTSNTVFIWFWSLSLIGLEASRIFFYVPCCDAIVQQSLLDSRKSR